MSNPGIRYERLLFWAAPITLAACAVFVSTVGYNTYEDRVAANCFDSSADVIKANLKEFSEQWNGVRLEQEKIKYRGRLSINYDKDVTRKLIYGTEFNCWQRLKINEYSFDRDPELLIKDMQSLAADLRKQPIKMYGIEIPDVAVIGLAGTKIQIAMANFIQALQVALAPMMLLWLGSLYHTRFREITAFKTHDNILGVHPHVINVFPVGYYPDLRKKSWFKSRVPYLWGAYFFSIRSSLVLCFIAPATVFYVASLFYQPIFGYWALNVFAGLGVSVYAFGVVIIEALVGEKHFKGEGALR
ncbi:hypothetical protein [Pseudomonas azotoformans]|uniref:hypothetical protein n=1 Tax=Pseudomonas azotoformans TaxID=47878 RepID=UPI00114780FC|nr:hypothetical protein [Pseudomonas azotoformans]QDH64172.1 hypothetical protein FKZ69_09170 [Pseudomonas azotoformans]